MPQRILYIFMGYIPHVIGKQPLDNIRKCSYFQSSSWSDPPLQHPHTNLFSGGHCLQACTGFFFTTKPRLKPVPLSLPYLWQWKRANGWLLSVPSLRCPNGYCATVNRLAEMSHLLEKWLALALYANHTFRISRGQHVVHFAKFCWSVATLNNISRFVS